MALLKQEGHKIDRTFKPWIDQKLRNDNKKKKCNLVHSLNLQAKTRRRKYLV